MFRRNLKKKILLGKRISTTLSVFLGKRLMTIRRISFSYNQRIKLCTKKWKQCDRSTLFLTIYVESYNNYPNIFPSKLYCFSDILFLSPTNNINQAQITNLSHLDPK